MIFLIPLESLGILFGTLLLLLAIWWLAAAVVAFAPVLAAATLVLVALNAVALLAQAARGRLNFRLLFLYQIVFFSWLWLASLGTSGEAASYSLAGIAGGLVAFVATGVAFGMLVGRLPKVPKLALIFWPPWFFLTLYLFLATPSRNAADPGDPLLRVLITAAILIAPAALALLLTKRRKRLLDGGVDAAPATPAAERGAVPAHQAQVVPPTSPVMVGAVSSDLVLLVPIPPVRVEYLVRWLREQGSAFSEGELRRRLVAGGHASAEVDDAIARLHAEDAVVPPVRLPVASSDTVEQRVYSRRFCDQCGAPLAPEARFCAACGRSVSGSETPNAD